MPLILKSALVATAACLTIAASTPSQAQDGYYANPAQHYDAYQNPDGTYDSLADLSRRCPGNPLRDRMHTGFTGALVALLCHASPR